MKNIILKIIPFVIITFFASQLLSQVRFRDEVKYDELIVLLDNGTKVSLKVLMNKRLNKNKEWRPILSSFQEDLKAVIENIPDYDFFKVEYTKGESMSVKELIGEKHYILSADNKTDVNKRNTCHLIGKDVLIEIQVQKMAELLDPDILSNVSTAISQLKRPLFSNYVENTTEYDVVRNKFIEIKEPTKFVASLTPFIGIYRAEPIVEINYGLGVRFGEKLLTLNFSQIAGYDKETQYGNYDYLLGAEFYPYSFGGLSVMVNLSDNGVSFIDHKVRYSGSFKYNTIVTYLDAYIKSDDVYMGFRVGLEF